MARGGLSRRTLIRGALLAVIGAAAFAVVLFSVASLYNESERRAQRSQEVLVVGNHLDRLVVDLETRVRGIPAEAGSQRILRK